VKMMVIFATISCQGGGVIYLTKTNKNNNNKFSVFSSF
jgi:hypothetical protein